MGVCVGGWLAPRPSGAAGPPTLPTLPALPALPPTPAMLTCTAIHECTVTSASHSRMGGVVVVGRFVGGSVPPARSRVPPHPLPPLHASPCPELMRQPGALLRGAFNGRMARVGSGQ